MYNQTLVLAHPSLTLQDSMVDDSFTPSTENTSPHYNILNVVEDAENKPYINGDNYSVFYATINEVSLWVDPIGKSLFTPDLILISSQLENYTDGSLDRLKQFCDHRAIPLILHSETFNIIAKNIAVEFKFDDYFSGIVSSNLIKKASFIKKLKVYKQSKTNEPATIKNREEIRTFKMWAFKRSFDILISAIILILISPLLLFIALAIKLESKGPIFYISKRAGNGYRIFNFYKFRSMRVGADAELHKLAHLNQYGDTTFFKIQNDPRVTRIGSFLRNTSLDEVPQFINVLLGDMSLVGNRPLPLYEAEKLTKDQIAWRFIAPAGITGLWQVTKRGKEDMSEEERIMLDMKYAMNNSFLYDIKILLSTLPALLQKEKV